MNTTIAYGPSYTNNTIDYGLKLFFLPSLHYIGAPTDDKPKLSAVTSLIKCMLIDDDIDDQEIFCLALQKINEQIQCEMVIDGVEAIKLLKSNLSARPDFIFIDVNMPRMDGLECLRQIKEIPEIRGARIFMFSTSSAPKLITNSKALGADGFIVKPPTISELTKKLAELF